MRSPLTTLCYIEKDGKYLMLHRVSKEHDVNKDKWIGIGGHFEEGESPEECLLREAKEETGLTLVSWRFRGIVTFLAEGWQTEYMCLYTADRFEGELCACDEGTLEWVAKEEIMKLNLWEGDKIFLKLLAQDAPFFSLKLSYQGDVLQYAALDGKMLELFDICDERGEPTGQVTERGVAHALGIRHRTVYVWAVRRGRSGNWQILMQKRSAKKTYPGCYGSSASGHVMAGDGYEESALRELEEELGIRAQPEELYFAGIFDSGEICTEFNGEPFYDREISSVYVYQNPIDIGQLSLQQEEVESVQWVDYEECLSHVLQGDGNFSVNIRGFRLLGAYLKSQE